MRPCWIQFLIINFIKKTVLKNKLIFLFSKEALNTEVKNISQFPQKY